MRLAWLGDETEGRVWREALGDAARGLDWRFVAEADWESLLTAADVDAVVLGATVESSLLERVRQLLAAEVPTVLIHPAAGVLAAYECEMARLDTNGLLLAVAPSWFHPAWRELTAGESDLRIELAARLGTLEQILWDRWLPDRRRSTVQRVLAEDIELLRVQLGVIVAVNTVGVARDDDTYTSFSVHLTGQSGVTATWNLAPNPDSARTRVQWIGKSATVCLEAPPVLNAGWRLTGLGEEREFPPGAESRGLVDYLHGALERRAVRPLWNDVCLDLEIAEAVDKSWRRKRAVDLNTGERSEEKTFKGFMAAGGCLILLIVLLAFLVGAVWDGIRSPFREMPVATAGQPPRDAPPRWPLWARLWPVYPLAGFLALQLLLNLTRSGEKREERG